MQRTVKKCMTCGKEFTTYSESKKYCQPSCYWLDLAKQKKAYLKKMYGS